MAVGTPRFGLWMFPDHPASVLADVIVAAEAAGLDEVWLGDEGPARDPLVTLAAAAVRTSTIALGVAVTNPYLRHPAATASAFATLAELAGPGRVVLGMGSGGDLALGPTGAVREQPLQRVTDAVRIARAVLRGEPTEGYEPPLHSTSAPDVRIVIGARSRGLNRLASAQADGVFIGGVPLPMIDVTLGWARSVRPVDVAALPERRPLARRGRAHPAAADLRAPRQPAGDPDHGRGRAGGGARTRSGRWRPGTKDRRAPLIDDRRLDQPPGAWRRCVPVG